MEKKKIKTKKSKDPKTPEPESNNEEEEPKPKKKQIASYEEMEQAARIKASLELSMESKKSKKRKKKQERALAKSKKIRSDQTYLDDILSYLRLYSEDKSNWKFQKMKQIFIQENAFNVEKFSDETWPLVLEYLGGSQGKSKDLLSKKAVEIIEKLDEEGETEQPLYSRARDLLQMLQ